jgi:hypothetical protein
MVPLEFAPQPLFDCAWCGYRAATRGADRWIALNADRRPFRRTATILSLLRTA